MKLAFHYNKFSFCDRWLEYCKKKGINFKLVNCYDSDIVSQLSSCDALFFHWMHFNYREMLFMKQLTFALEKAGKMVFPNLNTCWHFDDKVGQKYLLESIGAPLVPSYVFYDRKAAIDWCKTTNFPKVFKLRSGAGSKNVRLISTKEQALRIVSRMFGSGLSQYNKFGELLERLRLYRLGKIEMTAVFRGLARFFILPEFAKMFHSEKGYVYFQDFVEGNDSDTRVVVIGNRAFAIKRLVRAGDFRASGSGHLLYAKSGIDEKCVKLAFGISQKLRAQCLAYDFIFDTAGNPLLVEISYGFAPEPYDNCPGYWDSSLVWHEGHFIAQNFMIDDLIDEIERKVNSCLPEGFFIT